ncbi:MAG: 5'-nucleotidase, lipoprotein e(P4) family [Myxococcota bacterium]
MVRSVGWLALLMGCATTGTSQPNAASSLDAMVWTRTSAERDAVTTVVWDAAAEAAERGAADASIDLFPSDGRPADATPAVIVDVDETVLDNSVYQARLLESGGSYELTSWNAWCDEAAAPAIPGALAFAKRADAAGVRIFYVTNRRAVTEDATRKNLQALGFPIDASVDTVLLRDEREEWRTGDKTPRREHVAANHRVVALVGDTLGDFIEDGGLGIDARRALVAEHADKFGQVWFMLPNPMYGGWMNAVRAVASEGDHADVDAAKRHVVKE